MFKPQFTSTSPVGIFDSGVGGLTVMHSVSQLMPNENIIYLGDNARLPYGTKSKETVISYSIECLKFLLKKKVKIVIVACNTASSYALPFISRLTKIPVIGVIEPGANAAVSNTSNNHIGIIGTAGTVRSGSYARKIKRKLPEAKIYSKACSLFVQIAEDGWADNKIAKLTAKEYLTPLRESRIDTLIMGCTHYPILKKTISNVMGKKITLIDPGIETAKYARAILQKKNLLNKSKKKGYRKFYVTDTPNNFHVVAERFLEEKITQVNKIKIS
ncbi:MAG: glutamate racemase [Ignavibacteriaceae bacterium]|nr:MAG: glutamate racemase [Chlorobi bacterium OLB4]MBW7855746.1 glutamate racemase [Ignavibacteria bacterium]MEB2330527.1 glutamate racemase [Ignavibacteriaceae bacterium]OQY76481.1 MAG: glutamate racemase [Ignavibacteriales bacterium UTCHB1]